MRKIKINLENIEVSVIKELLWELCYNPENAMEELEIKVDNPKELINLILEECKNSGKELNFAGEKPYLGTYGIDIGISNPVVRDVILEHCYEAYEKELSFQNLPERAIEKIIKLLKTQENTDREYYEKRVFGGLRALNFSYEESRYLKDTCNLYPVGLFLERMFLAIPLENNFEEECCTTPSKEISAAKVVESVTEKPTLLLQNKQEIEKLYEGVDYIDDILSLDGLEHKVDEIQKEIERLQEEKEKVEEVIKTAKVLEERGISFEYLMINTGKILDLFEAAKNL